MVCHVNGAVTAFLHRVFSSYNLVGSVGQYIRGRLELSLRENMPLSHNAGVC